ncbi:MULTISPECIES: hypothetical protein [Neisseriaceae]|uniref:Conjugal transfer protein n=1 Tax=Morococcus cerebrosus TaxID=1056807 RepID=A0A0C1EBK1_9NEIS|nr:MULTISPECIES: hypothetical protein [Neisseriaceae]KIC06183.1 hypothetical protein MCC93_23610 [Morococcus cerebrosus]UNV88226.1 hypothetical protein MON37_04700 [Morococcus cerebrosus]
MQTQITKKKQIKGKIRQLIAAISLATIMASSMPAANAYVLPVIDGAKIAQDAANWAADAIDRATTLANWVTQLANWETQLKQWVRGQMEKIPGIKKLIDKREEKEFEEMFQKRRQRCGRITTKISQRFCYRTVDLEKRKFEILKKIEKETMETFDNINKNVIGKQNSNASNNSNMAATAESQAVVDLNALGNMISKHEAEIKRIDALLEHYKWARANIAKDQLSGNNTNTLTKAVTGTALQSNAADYREKAKQKRIDQNEIYNKFMSNKH